MVMIGRSLLFSQLIGVFTIAIISSCSFYYMQVPETVAVNEIVAGGGLTGTVFDYGDDESEIVLIPGTWARKGIAKQIDLGIHVIGVGLKSDIKYSFNKCFTIGLGGGAEVAWDLIYTAEGSLYGGLPIRTFYPYVVVRQHIIGNAMTGKQFFPLATVGGMCINVSKSIAIYFEGGARFNDDEESGVHPVAGIDISICQQK